MPYAELRKVWGDTSYVGWFPTVTALGYLNFYAAVRAVNVNLPVNDRIHVWLGGKPVDWSKIKTKEDVSKVLGGQADLYTADLIGKQILNRHKRALLIYGAFHFYDKGSLAEFIRQRYPGSLFVITLYTGFADRSCSERFETRAANWPLPALLGAGQPNQQAPDASCKMLDVSGFAEMTEAQRAKIRSDMESQTSVLIGNALLYLAPARTLTKSPLSPDLYLDPEFRKENDRRAALLGGLPPKNMISSATPALLVATISRCLIISRQAAPFPLGSPDLFNRNRRQQLRPHPAGTQIADLAVSRPSWRRSWLPCQRLRGPDAHARRNAAQRWRRPRRARASGSISLPLNSHNSEIIRRVYVGVASRCLGGKDSFSPDCQRNTSAAKSTLRMTCALVSRQLTKPFPVTPYSVPVSSPASSASAMARSPAADLSGKQPLSHPDQKRLARPSWDDLKADAR